MSRARATQADITRVVRAAGKAGIPALVVEIGGARFVIPTNADDARRLMVAPQVDEIVDADL
jgi:hypothetical protein